MTNIRSKIIRYMIGITFIIVLLVLAASTFISRYSSKHRARENAQDMFTQIERVLDENQSELEYVRDAYNKTCISNAHSIAYMLQYNPDVMDDIDALKEIARMSEVDEIHIFDTTGTIIKGTHPQYYGMNFDSGEQIGFFRPMLYDRSLELVQDITPNTAEERPMQYSAVWSYDGNFILQIGMEPVNVLRVTQKNELSYIFSLLNTGGGIHLYAIDHDTGKIKGSTVKDEAGKNIRDLGLELDDVSTRADGFNAKLNGENYFCVFKRLDDLRIGYAITESVLYASLDTNLLILALSLLLIALILVIAVTWYIHKYVIDSIDEINDDLQEINSGNLQKDVDVKGSAEFEELSAHINEVIRGILATTDKMSFVLNRTNMRIGVYEYNTNMKNVRFTDYVPDILSLSYKQLNELTSDYKIFQNYILSLKKNPLEGEEDTYILPGINPRYLKLEEVIQGNDTFGVIIDITHEVEQRLLAEADRDEDHMTGLLNRRGINENLEKLFRDPGALGYGAMVMIDVDYLKEVNDTYGHNAGDIYLTVIGEYLKGFGSRNNLTGRLGGDEFVMFLYEYNTEGDLMEDLHELPKLQDGKTITLENGEEVPIKFSAGYCLSYEQTDYHVLMRSADEKMYKNKRKRKNPR